MTAPHVEQYGEDIAVAWPGLCSLLFTHFIESRFGTLAELSVVGADLTEQGWGQVLLVSTDSRSKFAKRLEPPYAALIDLGCRLALSQYRRPAPWRLLEPRAHLDSAHAWLWTDWLPAGHTAVLYGDGDSGKSLLALTIALCALSGLPLAGTWPLAHLEAVLFVDYESTPEDHEHRLALLARALDVPTVQGLHYWRPHRPLPEVRQALIAQQQRTRAGLVIVDSLGAACGGEPESAQAAIGTLQALFALGPSCGRLVLAHVSKLEAGVSAGPRRAYGSVYVRNLPRVSIEMRRDDSEPGLRVTLREDKNNLLLRKPVPIGLRLEGGGDHLVWTTVAADPSALGVTARLTAALSSVPTTGATLATLAAPCEPATARAILSRLRKRNVAQTTSATAEENNPKTLWIRGPAWRNTEAQQGAALQEGSEDPPPEGGLSFP